MTYKVFQDTPCGEERSKHGYPCDERDFIQILESIMPEDGISEIHIIECSKFANGCIIKFYIPNKWSNWVPHQLELRNELVGLTKLTD